LIALVVIAPGAYLLFTSFNLPEPFESSVNKFKLNSWPEIPAKPEVNLTIFQDENVKIISNTNGKISNIFRYIGAYNDSNPDAPRRVALLADLRSGKTHILKAGDKVTGITVVRIFMEKVVLTDGTREEELFRRSPGKSERSGAGSSVHSASSSGAMTGFDRFGGKRVAARQWVFRSTDLTRYYQELLDEPGRLLKVFDSLMPVDSGGKSIGIYDTGNFKNIRGYRLNVLGEADFFKSVGFKQGDIVRKVNNVPMLNRRFAENFVNQFAQGQLNVVHIEIERNGKPETLIYQINKE
jgi:hypothetical protein